MLLLLSCWATVFVIVTVSGDKFVDFAVGAIYGTTAIVVIVFVIANSVVKQKYRWDRIKALRLDRSHV
jgi:hypothetical protein